MIVCLSFLVSLSLSLSLSLFFSLSLSLSHTHTHTHTHALFLYFLFFPISLNYTKSSNVTKFLPKNVLLVQIDSWKKGLMLKNDSLEILFLQEKTIKQGSMLRKKKHRFLPKKNHSQEKFSIGGKFCFFWEKLMEKWMSKKLLFFTRRCHLGLHNI